VRSRPFHSSFSGATQSCSCSGYMLGRSLGGHGGQRTAKSLTWKRTTSSQCRPVISTAVAGKQQNPAPATPLLNEWMAALSTLEADTELHKVRPLKRLPGQSMPETDLQTALVVCRRWLRCHTQLACHGNSTPAVVWGLLAGPRPSLDPTCYNSTFAFRRCLKAFLLASLRHCCTNQALWLGSYSCCW
jgi:hypothetical protein